jgi:hypothetical protein
MSIQTLITKICPYVEFPSGDCYCTRDGSQNIIKAVKYCSNNYEECPIFNERSSGLEKIVTEN